MGLEFSIHEITIAVNDIGGAQERFAAAFGGTGDALQHFPGANFQMDMGGVWIGDFHIAMASAPQGEGPIGRFLAKRGEGMYELNVRTNDLPAAIEHLKARGLRFINEEPLVLENYDAGHGTVLRELRLAFVDPRTTNGVLIEIAEWVP
jgi:methylmalonyl-CoA/ethylmalonyl-CoA epimerase